MKITFPSFSMFALIGALACSAPPAGVRDISQEEVLALAPGSALILDVRSEQEFRGGHVPNAVNIPHDQLASRLGELGAAQEGPVVVYCERGGRAGMATDLLMDAGYTHLLHLEGDMSEWRAAGHPTAQP